MPFVVNELATIGLCLHSLVLWLPPVPALPTAAFDIVARVPQDQDQFDRFLQIFLHDFRSPLGVAQGYMNLLHGGQLAEADRARAMQGILNALNRMTTLVDHAGELILPDQGAGAGGGRVAAEEVCHRVMSHATRRGVLTEPAGVSAGVAVRVGQSVDALADAIALLLDLALARGPATSASRLQIQIEGRVLRFALTPLETKVSEELVAFDPWLHGKIDYLVAHRRLLSVGGGAWCQVGKTRASCVTLPVDPV